MDAPKLTIRRAKALRRKLTLPEVMLWQAIRARKLDGIRFRRQHPVGSYILDYYCSDARLAVEMTGSGMRIRINTGTIPGAPSGWSGKVSASTD